MNNEYLKQIYGLLESGATLGTGAVSGLVGLPYGLYKGVTSGSYGTPQAPRIAAREAQQFMERNTYQPRTAEGQANLQQLAGLLEASKLPPIMPEASLLAAIPKQAYAAQAVRTGMAAEKAIAPVVTRTMERGGMPASLLDAMATNTVSPMFIGPQSKLWNKQAAEMAKKMDGKFSPTEIWEKTGTFKGKDKKWRQETSDQGLLAKPVDEWSWSSRTENKVGQSTVGPVSEFVSHPKLEESYGGLIDFGDAERRLMMKVRPDETIAGSYSGDAIETGMTGQGVNRGTVAHELQHAIQAREGFAKGGSPEYMPELYREESDRLRAQARTMIDEAMAQDPLDPSKVLKPGLRARGLQMIKEAQNLEAQANRLDQFGGNFEEYRRLMGEVEAEATRKRLDMTDEERRLRAPWLDYEFPLDQLRVIMKNDNNMVVPRTSGLLGQ